MENPANPNRRILYLPIILSSLSLIASIIYQVQRVGWLPEILDRFVQRHLDAISGVAGGLLVAGVIMIFILARRFRGNRLLSLGTGLTIVAILGFLLTPL
ncbi:MAG: hypothetical protein ABIR24_13525 [Verrucomicrobiota bacterium]